MKSRSILLSILGVCVVVFFVFIALFDRYKYFDFESAECRAEEIVLSVELIGTFEANNPYQRGSPYYLRVQQVSKSNPITVAELSLVSEESERVGYVTNSQKLTSFILVKDAPVLVIDDLILPFENYVLKIVTEKGSVFHCQLKMHYSSEWRLSFWDALLSV